MYVKKRFNSQSGVTKVQIAESYRDQNRPSKVIQKVLCHVGTAHNEEELRDLELQALVKMEEVRLQRNVCTIFGEEALDMALEAARNEVPTTKMHVEKLAEAKVVTDGPEVVYGKIFEELELKELLPDHRRKALKETVIARLAEPQSKLALAEEINEHHGKGHISVDSIYRMMDSLAKVAEKVKEKVLANTIKCEGKEVDVAFYDCTTLYFESTSADELRKFGFSKDSKHHQTQVVLALATTANGLPVDYALFPGNTAEVSTLIACLDKWKNIFSIRAITFVADRGIFSIPNLEKIRDAGYNFVVAFPMRKLGKSEQEHILSAMSEEVAASRSTDSKTSLPLSIKSRTRDLTDGKWSEISVEGTLHVSYSEDRASKDRGDRAKLIEKIKSKIGASDDPKRLISNNGYKKFVSVDKGKMELSTRKVAEDEKWDGLHGIFTNLDISHEEAREQYKRLWVIEQTFRISKSDLKIRPVFHWKPRRIEAHILICYISLAIARSIEIKLRQKGINICPSKLNKIVSKIGYCTVTDKKIDRQFLIPLQASEEAQAVLDALDIRRTTKARPISASL
jgi:transposase